MSSQAPASPFAKDIFAAAPALLGRHSTIAYGAGAHTLIQGQSVVVTGAGGSIGSEIVRQVRSLDAEHVYLVDQDEGALHALQLELSGNGLLTDPHVILADIRDGETIAAVLADIRPDIVFHAAAHKHLPLLERFPAEGIKANIRGTHNVVAAAQSAGARLIVNVSTDKAAEPTSVLGATKRIAEDIAACYADDWTRVASVRFGNVFGSRGSLLTSLDWQVRNGQPITITDPRVTRYFMTIPEAASLVIEAAVLADQGETYVLDMGDPVAIVDLVDRFLTITGADNPIIYTGLREGEKLDEQLVDHARERTSGTPHARISRIERQPVDAAGFFTQVHDLCAAVSTLPREDLLAKLWQLASPRVVPVMQHMELELAS